MYHYVSFKIGSNRIYRFLVFKQQMQIYDIRKAAESASINLNLRYDVVLQYPMLADENKVVVEI